MDIIAVGDNPSGTKGYNRASIESGGLFFKATAADTEAITEIILRSPTTDSTISIFEKEMVLEHSLYLLIVLFLNFR